MVRMARIVLPGWPHHVTQRGNRRQAVFFNDHQRTVYLDLLARYKRIYHVSLVGYCLMTNHVHKIPIPEYRTSLAKAIGRTHNDYSRWLNVQFNQTGHLWQARFYSCPVDLFSLAEVLAYVELNPVRAGLVKRPEDWKWSSARAHCTGIDQTGLLDMEWWRSHFTPQSWADVLQQKPHDREMLHRIRTATQTGRPFTSPEGLRQVELLLGRSLQRPKRRPRSTTS
jgi:putative transposase